jgi:hypothetical protein
MTPDREWAAMLAWVASDDPTPSTLDPAIGALVGTVAGVALWLAIYCAWRIVT